MSNAINSNNPKTLEDHQAIVMTMKPAADALPAEAVRAPVIPIPMFLEEGLAMAAASREHFDALAKVGVSQEQIDEMYKLFVALGSAQAVWQAERRNGRDEPERSCDADLGRQEDDTPSRPGRRRRRHPDADKITGSGLRILLKSL